MVRTIPDDLRKVPLTADDCRSARALLGWGQEELAARSSVPRVTISRFEGGSSTPVIKTLEALRAAFESTGLYLQDIDGRHRLFIKTSCWLVAFLATCQQIEVGDRIEVNEGPDETLRLRNVSRNYDIRAASAPLGGQWRYNYARAGDKGIVYEVSPPRQDPDYGDVCQVSYRLDPFDIETAIRGG
ncbi:helix-turn-helix domain-containing protein [Acetobacter sp. AN02]|uniref:helix-turn-helix domain-containing protein n=1 Tax=Acetobacter sp. AN02 TaxID=2894186 RepID=UPI0024340D04|nr:helix-turn-helix transcriptional regulator [Acetobacter sp. AN02]MDG6095267.1 helix-turn-helix domain-containing protein [Acetobacter sp. AN02]